MKIDISRIAFDLETITTQTKGREFSGFAWVKPGEGVLTAYDYVLLDVGSEVLTDIPPEEILPLLEREDRKMMKLWFHRHPVGNGNPGMHNWSGTDNNTIHNAPLGSIPELVKWSASIVRTPLGWVGRIDDHIKKKALHVPVVPSQGPIVDRVASLNMRAFQREKAYWEAKEKERKQAPKKGGLQKIIDRVRDIQWGRSASFTDDLEWDNDVDDIFYYADMNGFAEEGDRCNSCSSGFLRTHHHYEDMLECENCSEPWWKD